MAGVAFSANPSGSKNPTGSRAPGRPSADAWIAELTLLLDVIGANAEADAMRAKNAVNFILICLLMSLLIGIGFQIYESCVPM